MMNKAVFLDRDGVINQKREGYVKNIQEFVLLKDAPVAIKLLNENRFLVIIVTNQSAINRGLITHQTLNSIHNFMKYELQKYDCHIDAIYYCPHKPDENCLCRKPKTGLIDQAAKDYSIDMKSSWLIGDNESDINAARIAGIRAIMLKTDSSLLEAVKQIL